MSCCSFRAQICLLKSWLLCFDRTYPAKRPFLATTGLDPVVHADLPATWIAGSSPAMTPGNNRSSYPALRRASTTFGRPTKQDVDGRGEPGHDEPHTSTHSRARGNPAWVPAFARTSGRDNPLRRTYIKPAPTALPAPHPHETHRLPFLRPLDTVTAIKSANGGRCAAAIDRARGRR